MRDELAVRGEDHCKAVSPDADAIDGAPHFLETELSHEPSGRFAEPRQVDHKERRWELVLIELDWRHADVVEESRRVFRNCHPGGADATRRQRRAVFAKDADLAKLADLQDVV